jgi:hypothetical protein
MIKHLACAIYREFEYRSSTVRFKPKTIQMQFITSPLSTQHFVVKAKTGWLGIRIMCPSGATCLSVDCGFSELALLLAN